MLRSLVIRSFWGFFLVRVFTKTLCFVFADRQMQLASRMEFEEQKFRLLAFIVIAEMKLKSWTVKLGRQPEVEEMLDDYNVRQPLP